MATLAVAVFRLSPQDIVGFRIRTLTHVVASYVIRDLIMNTYRDKHRSGNVAVQGIHARSYSSCTGKHGSYKSFETQIIPSVERITPWQEQNISVETQLVNPFCEVIFSATDSLCVYHR